MKGNKPHTAVKVSSRAGDIRIFGSACISGKDGPRERVEPEMEWRSVISWMLSRGGANKVDADPDPLRILKRLLIDIGARIDPAGLTIIE